MDLNNFMIKFIFFDVDGTMMDTKDIFFRSLKEVLGKHNIKRRLDESLFGLSVDQALKKLKIYNQFDVKYLWEKRFYDECKKSSFYPGIEEVMQILDSSGIVIYIITSRSHSTTDYILDSSSVGRFIKGCIAAEDTFFHKPNPAPIIKAIEDTNAIPDEVLYIGDTYQDYKAAVAAGVKFGFAGWNKNAQNNNYKIVFEKPHDIVTMCVRGEIDG